MNKKRSFIHFGRNQNILFIVLMFLGVFLVMQFRAVTEKTNEDGTSAREMASKLDVERSEGKKLLQTLTAMEGIYAEKLRNIGEKQGDQAFSDLLEERDRVFFRSGLTDVKGEGVILTMNDAVNPGEMAIEEYIIHDSDVTTILNELRLAGAQAISINGERVLGLTKTVCAGPTILINRSRYAVPYEFKAVGDAQKLFQALDNSEAVGILRLYNIRVEMKMATEITINRFQTYDIQELMTGLEVVAK